MSARLFSPQSFGPVVLPADRPFIIAEAGVNHGGSAALAKQMIVAAAEAGADAIKFQSYKAERLASRKSPAYWNTDCEPAKSQFELFKRYDSLEVEDYERLADIASAHGILFMTTPFDEEFVEALNPYLSIYKVASADITNEPLLGAIARKNKPIILSVGASTLDEVHRALRVIREHNESPVALLHCVLSYPCRLEDANLLVIKTLQSEFPDAVIGYSDHVPPETDDLPLITAWLLGARLIEKHFTLDKRAKGNDHYHAMDPSDLIRYRKALQRLDTIAGSPEKTVLNAESTARTEARRSLVAACDIPEGHEITRQMLAVKRPGSGISPTEITGVIGRTAATPIEQDTPLSWQMLR
jgi:sialic acid synthase SpsE